MRFAENANYFETTVHPANSMGEIQAMLDDFGATSINTMTGTEGEKSYWMIRFKWMNQYYRFTFQPLQCENPEKEITRGGKRRTCLEQSKYQMGRIAVYAVKAILTAAEAMPGSLFGFAELAAVNQDGLPIVMSEISISGLNKMLPDQSVKALTAG